MVIVQEICQGQLQTAVLRKTGYPRHKPGSIAVGSANVVQNILGGLLFQLYITPFRCRNESVFNFSGHAASGVGQQGGELVLEIVLLIGLADEVQHRQALLILRKPQATAQLLEEDGQGLGGT